MAVTKKVLLKEITELKKRLASTCGSMKDVYKDFSKEAKKAYKDTFK